MWVEKTKNGLRLCERFKGIDGKMHRASVPLSKDTAQARKIAAADLLEKININQIDGSTCRLSSLCAEYLRRSDIKDTSRHAYSAALARAVQILGDVEVSRLSAPYIKRRFSESGKKPKTLNNFITVLNTFLSWAYDFGYISQPVHVSKFPNKEPKRDPTLEYLERDELEHVLAQLEGSQYYFICKFLALTGCRIGELAALTPEDIDGKYIHITKSRNQLGQITTPKTAASRRDIFITPELSELLRAFKEWRLLYIMAHKIRPQTLFFSSWALPVTSARLNQVFAQIDSPKHLHAHIFRHTHVSLLAEQGVSLETIARRLGHTTSKTTREIYFHVTEKLKERDEAVLQNVKIIG